MKKIIIVVFAVLLLVVGYNMWGGNAPDETAVEVGAKEDQGIGSGLSKSFQGILPGDIDGGERPGKLEASDHVVVIHSKPTTMDVEDVIDRIAAQKDLKDNEAIDFARWTLFSENAKYSPEEKERILERSVEILSPAEAGMLTRDVLLIGKVPDLVDEAMNYQSQNLKREDFEILIREVLKTRVEPEIRSAVIESAATKNIYVK